MDSRGRVVVINRCFPGDQGMLTAQGQTDILYIDLKKGKVVKRVEMMSDFLLIISLFQMNMEFD